MKSLMYLCPRLYTSGMRLLYWPNFEDRYQAVARLIPPGSSVVDVCCGDAYLYRFFLRQNGVRYIGLDNSPRFVSFGRKEGIDVRLWDGRWDPVPQADIVLIQGSLCHFMPSVEPLIERLRAAARRYVVISEPIRSHTVHPNPVVAALSRRFTTPVNDDGDYRGERYTMDSFKGLARELPGFQRFYTVPGDRDMIAVLAGAQTSSLPLPREEVVAEFGTAEAEYGELAYGS